MHSDYDSIKGTTLLSEEPRNSNEKSVYEIE